MSFELIIMTDLENPFTPYTKNVIACINSNIKTSGSQKFKLVTRFCKNKILQFKIYIFCLRNKDKGLLKSLTKTYQYVGYLQVCFTIYRYRLTIFQKSSLLDFWQNKSWLNSFLIVWSRKQAYKICPFSVAIIEWFVYLKPFIKKS